MQIIMNNEVTDIRIEELYTFKSHDLMEFYSNKQGGVWYEKQFYNNILKPTHNNDDVSSEDVVLVNNCFLVSAKLLFKQLGYLDSVFPSNKLSYQRKDKIQFDLIRQAQR